jgi:hypothetical protein
MMREFSAAVITAVRERASALVIGLSLATVALTTGFISYTHISALTIHEHQSWKSAHLYPLTVDGQIAIGSVILMEMKGKHRWWGLVGFLPGLVESLVANWASGWQGHNLGAALWSTVPAQAFACSTFLFEMWLRYRRRAQPSAVTESGDAAPPRTATLLAESSPQAPGPAAPAAQEAAPVDVHLHAAPAGAPWGLVSPAAAPLPVPSFAVPVAGPFMTLASRPKPARPRRPQAVPGENDERLPLPQDPAELRALVNSMSRNALWQGYRVSKHGADKLRDDYLDEREVA